jgi:NADPH:quinone reductase
MAVNRRIILKSRPKGKPARSDFELEERKLADPGEGELLIETHYISVDPYMRGRISGRKSYIDTIPVGGIMEGGAVGRVAVSNHPDFAPGDFVLGMWGWQEYHVSEGSGIQKVDTGDAPLSTALGILGMPGMTAYFGLLDIGQPEAGENVFISGAAGAVGSAVGQIAKLKGCQTAGSAGSPEKINWIRNDLGFDNALNYRECDDYAAALADIFPDGIDVYFDNVGGPLTDAVFMHLRENARIVICGQIDQYNATEIPQGPRLLSQLIVKRARAEGFLVFDYLERFPEARTTMAEWIRAGRLKYRETITDGIENTPAAFIGLFEGENIGKQLVRTAAAQSE